MLQPDGRSRLADLGLATADDATRLTREGTLLGTVLYMPPEAARGEAWGPPADVFAFGLVLWEAATGRHPYGGIDGAHEYLYKLVRGSLTPPPRPDDMDAELWQVLATCLEPAPEDRPPDGTALLRLIEGPRTAETFGATATSVATSTAAATARVVITPTPRPPSPAGPRSPRNPLLACLGAVLALVLGLVALRAAFPSPEAPPIAAPPEPRVGCLLYGVELRLPAPPPPGTTARLMAPDGTLLVERSMHSATVVLRAPPGFAGPLRWAVTGGGSTVAGQAAVGPRLLFDPSSLPSTGAPTATALAIPPLFAGGRMAQRLAPATVVVLERRRDAGEPLTLSVRATHGIPVLPRPSRPAPEGLDLPLTSTEAEVFTARGDAEVIDALAVPRPGGGFVSATDLIRKAPDGPRREVVVAFVEGSSTAMATCELTLPGFVPQGLAPLDADRVLMVYGTTLGARAAVIRRDETGVRVVATLPLDLDTPTWRDGGRSAWLTLDPGGAALGLTDRLVVARADGSLFQRPLDPGPDGGVAALTSAADGSVLVVLTRLAFADYTTTGAVEAQTVRIDDDAAPVAPPGRIFLTTERVDEIAPLGLVPGHDGGFLLYACGLLIDAKGPPGYEQKASWRVDRRPGWTVIDEGSVFIVTTEGRVHGFDLPGGGN